MTAALVADPVEVSDVALQGGTAASDKPQGKSDGGLSVDKGASVRRFGSGAIRRLRGVGAGSADETDTVTSWCSLKGPDTSTISGGNSGDKGVVFLELGIQLPLQLFRVSRPTSGTVTAIREKRLINEDILAQRLSNSFSLFWIEGV